MKKSPFKTNFLYFTKTAFRGLVPAFISTISVGTEGCTKERNTLLLKYGPASEELVLIKEANGSRNMVFTK